MWHKIKKEKNVMKQYAAIIELDKIHKANSKLLEEAKKPETNEQINAVDRDYKIKDISKRKGLKKTPEKRIPEVKEKL